MNAQTAREYLRKYLNVPKGQKLHLDAVTEDAEHTSWLFALIPPGGDEQKLYWVGHNRQVGEVQTPNRVHSSGEAETKLIEWLRSSGTLVSPDNFGAVHIEGTYYDIFVVSKNCYYRVHDVGLVEVLGRNR
ncbi:hypothetical protein HY407_03875 [Candidatus Gottesmanbacteria bacterium]|nr:hypothetical protein [Candidatus Gottesmanbacteria bacterium]